MHGQLAKDEADSAAETVAGTEAEAEAKAESKAVARCQIDLIFFSEVPIFVLQTKYFGIYLLWIDLSQRGKPSGLVSIQKRIENHSYLIWIANRLFMLKICRSS